MDLRRTIRTITLASGLVLVATACGGDDEPAAATTTSSSATTEPTRERCSASGLDDDAEPQDGLPDAVARTRQEIVAAAVACDYDALSELAGDEFSYTFGRAEQPPGEYWRDLEARGEDPLRALVELLNVPYGTIDIEGAALYVWPSAFTYESWDAVPEEDKRALESLYDEEDFEAFETSGSYLGYRIGIREDGRWLYFIAGD